MKIDKIIVRNSGNDCLDISSGKYFISSLEAEKCYDKGISVGESSFVDIQNAKINNTRFALVSKDSSELILRNGTLNNNIFCLAAYNKKQEFGPSKITAPKGICPEDKFAIQNHSIFIPK